MRIGVIGSAVVGQTLASGFKKHGHDVRIASRTPAKLADFSKSSGIPAGTFPDVASWAEADRPGRRRGGGRWTAVREIGAGESGGKTGHRRDESDCQGTARGRCGPLFHVAQRVADGAPAGGRTRGEVRQGVQQRRQWR